MIGPPRTATGGATTMGPVSRSHAPVRRHPLHPAWLLAAAAVLGATDVAIGLAEPPTTGFAGPYAGLVLPLVVSLSLPLLVVAPRAVVALLVVVALLMAWSDAVAPGVLVPETRLTPLTVPRAAPLVIIWLVLAEPARIAYPVTALLAVLAARVWDPSWSETPFGLLGTVLPAVGALYAAARADLLRSLRDRAERAEREQLLVAEKARADERRRLAVEMHDVVTHRISGMVLHASALGVSSADPAVQRAAADLRDAGTRALDELRDLVGVLHGGTGDALPAARGGAVPAGGVRELVDASRAGLGGIALDLEGTPDAVSPTVARTAYRVVQEALTNARRHAPGADVAVEVGYGRDDVRVLVRSSPGRRAPDPALGHGSGRGLDGLAHRVALVGGTLRAGPTDGGGFLVEARLPASVPTSGAGPREQAPPDGVSGAGC
jgi:signal transduction histidine kinase